VAQKYRRLVRNFAANLRGSRGKKTVRAFAEGLGMYPAECNKLEIGRKTPSFTKLPSSVLSSAAVQTS
jgi:hypothetical protein